MQKRTLALLAAFLLFIAHSHSQIFTVGSFNIRYDTPKDTGNLWIDRAPVVANLIRFHEFDVLGIQEGLKNQLEDIQKLLPEYAYYGKGRDDGKWQGEHSAIFYKKDIFMVLDSGDFWLSQTPDRPGFGWDARINRICTWLKLKRKNTSTAFYVFNVHYDHQGITARNESSKLALSKIEQIAKGEPVIFMGDFNGNHQTDWYLAIKNSTKFSDVYLKAPFPYTNNGTFNSFKVNNPSKDFIDHIFITAHFQALKYGILTDTYHGRFPSDHYPILARILFKKKHQP